MTITVERDVKQTPPPPPSSGLKIFTPSNCFLRVLNYCIFIIDIGILCEHRMSFICKDISIDLSSCTNVFNHLGKLTGVH